ncbi:DNA topology modulation protein FlaR [Neobacillus notoginsengisoli]|uniref:DNA topology modulation protein FlaR n=2 Tax=Neobacillus notoginsengisoli TaxID=1578198 RepID=A0A417Z0B9_9BACI|nr:DNA topology modulation protein FlaR [Neobacillus notoginsengisoli]
MKIPFYELDNVVRERHPLGDRRRTEIEVEKFLEAILLSDTWIIEGVHNEEWTSETFLQADMIIFLDPAYSTRTYRIIRRFILQKLGFEKANYTVTNEMLFKMFKWNRHFEQVGKPNFFNTYADGQKLRLIRKKKDLSNLLSELSVRWNNT